VDIESRPLNRLDGWTGIFEFRYYNNEARERWGYTDDALALRLSKELGEAWRLEVLDGAGFWLYAHCVNGEETEGRAYQDTAADRTTDRSHPRYELNTIIDRERFRNIGLAYEHIPGPSVAVDHPLPKREGRGRHRGCAGLGGHTRDRGPQRRFGDTHAPFAPVLR
jgi:hypothetical protein